MLGAALQEQWEMSRQIPLLPNMGKERERESARFNKKDFRRVFPYALWSSSALSLQIFSAAVQGPAYAVRLLRVLYGLRGRSMTRGSPDTLLSKPMPMSGLFLCSASGWILGGWHRASQDCRVRVEQEQSNFK